MATTTTPTVDLHQGVRPEEIVLTDTIDLRDPQTSTPPPLGSDYKRLWLATAVSNVGDGVRIAALPLLAASFTRDPLLISGVLFATKLPWLLFSLHSGAIVDRVDRRKLMILVAVLRGAVMGALALSLMANAGGIAVVYAVALLLGIGEVFADNASFALLPSVAPPERLEDANGRMEAAVVVTNEFLGPALGGLLFAAALGAPFALDAATFAAAAALLMTIKHRPVPRPVETETRKLRHDIAEGVQWLKSHRLLRNISLVAAGTNLVLHATFAIAVLYALEVLGVNGVGFGLLLTVEAIGALIGSLLAGAIRQRFGAAAAVSGALLLAGAANLTLGLTKSWLVAGIAMAAVSFGGGLWNVITSSMRQRLVPAHLMGRVQSTHRLLSWGSIPLGTLMGGVLAKTFGLTVPFLVAAAVLVVGASVVVPLLRNATEPPEGGPVPALS